MKGATSSAREDPRGEYFPFLVVFAITLAAWVVLSPADLLVERWRVVLVALACGFLTGAVEICYRYRDEPLQAAASPFGLIYALINGGLSVVAVILLYRYPQVFGDYSNDGLKAAVIGGFGATIVMRSKFAVIKGGEGQDVAIGPDYAISGLLKVVDRQVDRFRAAKRQSRVVGHLPDIQALGSFDLAAKYLLASLLAFQNADEDLKRMLNQTIADYEKAALPPDIKYLALGFIFLTIVGEAHFSAVLKNAAALKQPGANAPVPRGALSPP